MKRIITIAVLAGTLALPAYAQRISQLPAAGSASGSDELPSNQGGTTRKLTVTQILALISDSNVPDNLTISSSSNLETAGCLQIGSLTSSSATCICDDADRAYADKDCDGTKDAGEEYLDASGGGSSDSFVTQDTPSGTDPVADSATDVLQWLAGQDITITGNSTNDSITIAFDGNLTAGTTLDGATIQTGTDGMNDLSDMSTSGCDSGEVVEYNGSSFVCATDNTGGGSANSFETHSTPSGTSPVASSATDTLTWSAGQDITITGTAGTDTIAIALDGDLTGGTTLGGAAIQTGTDDDQPDSDGEVPDDITVASSANLATAGRVQLGSLTVGSASCVTIDSDRPYADKDCDGTKDAGEEYLDASGGGGGADSVGTSELDDGTDTPLAGEYVRVDPLDTTQFQYRTSAEVRGDIGAASTTDLIDAGATVTAADDQIMIGDGSEFDGEAIPNGVLYYDAANNDVEEHETCDSTTIQSMQAADDDLLILGPFPYAVTVEQVGCRYEGTGTTVGQVSLEDTGGNAMTHTVPTCTTGGTAATFQSISAGGGLTAGEGLRLDVDNTPDPTTDDYIITVCWTRD